MADLNKGVKLCTNCKQNINLASFLMHEIFCLKNIIICERCNNPFDKNQKQEHFEEYHAPVKCECGESIEIRLLDAHKLESCRKRQSQCYYCELMLDSDKIEDHIEFCGTRTELCTKCSRYIKIKDFNQHESSNCAYPIIVERLRPDVSTRPFRLTESFNSLDKNYLDQFNCEASEIGVSMLPCEFCNDFFQSHELLRHQNLCDLNPSLPRYSPISAELNLPSNLNLGLINRIDISNDDSDMEESLSPQIPCEICNRLFDFDDIIVHQANCTSETGSDSTSTGSIKPVDETERPS